MEEVLRTTGISINKYFLTLKEMIEYAMLPKDIYDCIKRNWVTKGATPLDENSVRMIIEYIGEK